MLKAGVPSSSPETMVFLRVSLPNFPKTTLPGPEREYGGVGIRKVVLGPRPERAPRGVPKKGNTIGNTKNLSGIFGSESQFEGVF